MKDKHLKKACQNFGEALRDQIETEQYRIAYLKKEIEFCKKAIANSKETIKIAMARHRDNAKRMALNK